MSTILEMAEIVRADEARQAASRTMPVQPRVIEVFTPERMRYLGELFDVTLEELRSAIDSVGADPTAIGRFLRSHRSTRRAIAAATE